MHVLYDDASVKIDDLLNDPTNVFMKFEYRDALIIIINIEKLISNFFNSKYRIM